MAFLQPDKTSTLNGLIVKEYLLTNHNPYNIIMPSIQLPKTPLGITIHNTDWITTASGTTPAEQYTRATVNGNMNDVRVHYYVDNICAWQNLPLTLSGFHAADGNGNGNTKTIAIECIMSANGGTASEKSEDNCARLAAYLLNLYGLNVENNLFTHTHWLNVKDGITGDNDYLNTHSHPYKSCPLYILPHWQTFKAKVKSYLDQLKAGTSKPSSNSSTSTTNLYRVRKSWEDTKSQIGAFTSLDRAKKACNEGYYVFDSSGKAIYPTEQSKSTTASSNSTITTEQSIYAYLRQKGFNDYSVSGIMGNLYAESNLQSTNLQNTYNNSLGMTDDEYTKAVDNNLHDFVNDSAGYGLAQWTYYSRKQALLNFAKEKGKSIGDTEMQLEFLIKELKEDFSNVYSELLKATSVKQASDCFMTKFESPADQSSTMKNLRASYGEKYYKQYCGTTAAAPTVDSKDSNKNNNSKDNINNNSTKKIDITYCVNIGSWLPPVVNCEDETEDGYAGIKNTSIRALAAKVSEGTLKYRVHIVNGGWLGWISNYKLNDFYHGYAGLLTDKIDAVQAELTEVPGYQVVYRTSTSSKDYYPWVTGTRDYAGVFGKLVDRVQMKIVKL